MRIYFHYIFPPYIFLVRKYSFDNQETHVYLAFGAAPPKMWCSLLPKGYVFFFFDTDISKEPYEPDKPNIPDLNNKKLVLHYWIGDGPVKMPLLV